MSLSDFDWSTFIAEVTEVPADVVFQIEEDGQLHDINAHKMVLGMVSPTFKTMFYTTDVGDKTTKEIKIEATTKQALQIIIDALYKIISIEDSLQGKSLQEIFDVVNLIERYQMGNLQNGVNEVLSNYPITDDTVLEVAAEAIHQSSLFQMEARLLLLTCAKFIKPKLKDIKSVFNYFEENDDQKEVVAALMVLMNDTALTEFSNIAPIGCSNCGYEDCQDGKPVKEGDFREGLLVTNNRVAGHYVDWNSHDWGTGKVTKVDATHVTIGTIKRGIVHGFDGTYYNYFLKTVNGVNLFLFMCN